jgi:signal transduction histidine kinase
MFTLLKRLYYQGIMLKLKISERLIYRLIYKLAVVCSTKSKIRYFLLLMITLHAASMAVAAIQEDPSILKSDSLYRKAAYHDAILVLQNRLGIAKQKNELNLQAVIYNSLGKTYSQLGKPVEALKNYQMALKIAETTDDKQRSGKILKNIGALYEEQKNFKSALEYYSKAEYIAKAIGDNALLADCYNNRGVVYEQQLRYDKALDIYKKALVFYEKAKQTDRVALTLNNIGIVYKFLGNYQQSIAHYNRSLQYSEQLGDRFFIAANLTNIGNVYALMKNYDKAILYNTRGLKMALAINANNIVAEAYGSLGEDHAGKGNYKAAYELKNKYIIVNNEYINTESSKQLAELQTLYETEKKERQISALKQQHQISSLKNTRQELLIQKRNYQIGIIIVSALILVLLGYLFYRRQRIRQRYNNEKAIINAENKERSRIAKDVHDDIGSGLSKITLMADLVSRQMADKGSESREVGSISQISKDLIENMRDLIWILNPENSTLDNLVSRIREYCSDYLEGLIVKTEFAIQDEIPDLKIAQQAQRNIFLTVKEALHNCVKHAACDKITVRLTYNNGLLTVSIIDSGKGFDPEEFKRNGNGLRNMRQRMQTIGGNFHISSVPGTGTTVHTLIQLDTTT